jgi:hypothetical protein
LQVIPSKIADMTALLQQLTPIVDLTPQDIADFRDDMHHNSRYKEVTLKSDLSDVEVARLRSMNFISPASRWRAISSAITPTAPSWRTWLAMSRKSTTAICKSWPKPAKRELRRRP